MKKFLVLAAAAVMGLSAQAQAEYKYGFGSMYLDYQHWRDGANPITGPGGQDRASGRNQAVLGLEGGAGFSWGEVYGFYDHENIGTAGEKEKTSVKGSAHIYLGDSGLSAYGQFYNHANANASEHNQVLGLGYTGLAGKGWFFKPWIGMHQIHKRENYGSAFNYSGDNGYMAGWSAMYRFNEDWSFVNWNEIEFDRAKEVAAVEGGDSSIQGAAIIFYHLTQNFKMGVQYRYFENKLGVFGSSSGTQHYGDALIYRIAYDF